MLRTGILIGVALGYFSAQPTGKKIINGIVKNSNSMANKFVDKGLETLKQNFPNTMGGTKNGEETTDK